MQKYTTGILIYDEMGTDESPSPRQDRCYHDRSQILLVFASLLILDGGRGITRLNDVLRIAVKPVGIIEPIIYLGFLPTGHLVAWNREGLGQAVEHRSREEPSGIQSKVVGPSHCQVALDDAQIL